jgi:3-hydroxyacyl-[acyl-carrier-protein] dehydratase
MRFNLVDRILEVKPGKLIRAVKNLTLGEDYLADHFPTFPVMPGVMMLQTLVEAGSWLWRVSDDFSRSIIVLREAQNVKYGSFMDPGRSMRITVECIEQAGSMARFKGKGETEGIANVSARFTMCGYNLRERNPARQALDDHLVRHWKAQYALLRGEFFVTAVGAAGDGVNS